MSLTFTIPFVGTPAFYTGTSSSALVPDVFPVAINGRPYMVDMKSGQLARGFEQRVRDSVDQSTAPGEAAINPGGLWRRGEVSWHYGAGQKYADTAESQDYRFYKSKGVNVWTKGQLSLLNATQKVYPSSNTNLKFAVTSTRIYILDGADVKYSTGTFTFISKTVSNVSASTGTVTYTTSSAHGFTAGQKVSITGVVPTEYNLTDVTIATTPSSTTFTVTNGATGTFVSGGTATQYPVWTTASGLPAATPVDITSDGVNVYITYPGTTSTYGLWKYTTATDTAANVSYGHQYGYVDFVKGFFITTGNAAQSNGNDLYFSPTGNVSADNYEHPVSSFEWIGSASGQNAIYIAGKNGDYGSVYKLTIKADGTLDTPVLALELPREEYPTDIHGYLGFIILGTNKGVRFCTPDSQNNLVAGQLIATGADVKGFTSAERFVWFGWTNYDGTSGLGRLDLSTFTAANTPAYATDLMYSSSSAVVSAATFNNKRLFSVTGVGIIAEDTANLVTSGSIETGHYRWGIPDRKFVARVDTRSLPLTGTIESYMALDGGNYDLLGTWEGSGDTENSFAGSDDHAIEAQFKFILNRDSALVGPTLTRWAARAYAAPYRSQFFRVPVLVHDRINVHGKDYYFDVDEELGELRQLIASPRIVTLQINSETVSVIVEDMEWVPVDSAERDWIWQGTATVTMRSVEE